MMVGHFPCGCAVGTCHATAAAAAMTAAHRCRIVAAIDASVDQGFS